MSKKPFARKQIALQPLDLPSPPDLEAMQKIREVSEWYIGQVSRVIMFPLYRGGFVWTFEPRKQGDNET